MIALREIKGPSALGGDPRRALALTRTLAYTDFKLKFFGSVLGYLWQLMRPLLLFGVLYVVFTQFVRLGGGVAFYPAILLMGIVLFNFFAEATGGSVSSVVDRESLVRKIQFPRIVIPAAVVVSAILNLALNMLAVVFFMLLAGVPVRAGWLALPLAVGALAVLCLGIASLLSALYVRFRDVRPIWDVCLQVLFYASPVLYPIELVPVRLYQQILMLNPLAAILQEVRHTVIDPSAPSAAAVIGGGERLLAPAGIALAVCVLGFWVFNREAPGIAEEL